MNRFVRAFDFVCVFIALLALWQVMHLIAGGTALPGPMETVQQLARLGGTERFWLNVGETGRALLIAAVITTFGGTLLGLVLGLHKLSGEVASPILVSFYSLPKVVLYPVVLLFFGIGLQAKVALGVLNGVAPVVLLTMDAVHNINPTVLRTARSFRLSAWDTMFNVLLPAVLPEVLAGVRMGMALTIVGVLIGEIFASDRGLGFLLTTASQLSDNATVMATTLFIVLVALLVNWLLGRWAHGRGGRDGI